LTTDLVLSNRNLAPNTIKEAIMEQQIDSKCAACGIDVSEKACIKVDGKGPKTCPTKKYGKLAEEIRKNYQKPSVKQFARLASIQEAQCYEGRDQKPFVMHCSKTRIQETCEFAHKLKAKKIGLAFCAGLTREAKIVNTIFKEQGFDVVSVICKVGRLSKETDLGLKDEEKIVIGTDEEAACNPILQAEILNRAQTDLNVVMGLCVGHDSMLIKHVDAYTTFLAVKDRVTGHNPLAAIYSSNSYHSYLNKPGF
jgi:uncharacterized metal-binding protein